MQEARKEAEKTRLDRAWSNAKNPVVRMKVSSKGNSHKAHYERYLGMLSDVKAVSVDPILK